MARMMRDGHLGFAHLREIDPPRTPRISGRYLDRWVGVWENACNVPDAFQRMARDLGEFWLLDQWFTVASADTCRARPACGCPRVRSVSSNPPYSKPRMRGTPTTCAIWSSTRGSVPTPVRRGAGRAPEAMVRLGARHRVPGRSGGRPVRRGARHARGRHPRRRIPPRHDAHTARRLGTPSRLDTARRVKRSIAVSVEEHALPGRGHDGFDEPGPVASQRGDRMRGEQTDRTASIAVCAPQCGLCIRAGIKPGLYA